MAIDRSRAPASRVVALILSDKGWDRHHREAVFSMPNGHCRCPCSSDRLATTPLASRPRSARTCCWPPKAWVWAGGHIRIELWPASKRAGFPPPVPAKAGPMPTYESLGPDDRDGLEDRWKPSIQRDQEQAIPIRELNATAHPPLQHNQLMSERRVLCRKSVL